MTEFDTPYHLTFRAKVLRALGLNAKLNLRRQPNGQFIISDGQLELAIVSPSRAKLYRLGIANRLNKLRCNYSIGTSVPIGPGDLIVNFGANIGELILSVRDSGAQFVAIDPDPVACLCLKHNVGHLARIVETGLWNEDTEVTFYQKPESADTTAIDNVGEPLAVNAKRLDTVMADYDGRVRLVVGDAEGAEPEVLEGAKETLNRTDYLSIAVGPERSGKMTADTCLAIVRSCGFDTLPSPGPKWLLARNRNAKKD